MSDLIEDRWIFISALTFSFSQYVALVEVFEENSASYKFVIGRQEYINYFFRFLWIFFDLTLKCNK